MKFIHIRNRAYDRYVREDNEVCLEQRMVRINGRFCWRWCVYADCGGNVVELAANFYNAGLWEMPGFEMVYATCDTAFTLILEAFRLRRAKLFYKDGEVSAEWEERK